MAVRWRCAVAVLFALALLAPGALGARPVATATKATVRSLNAEARRLFNLGQFAKAAERYRRAYELDPLPAFLHNIGQCYRRLGKLPDLQRAKFYFESYLNNAQSEAERRIARRGIENVEERIRELRAEQARARATSRPIDLSPKPPHPPKASPFYKRWWFWTAVGLAVGGGVAATVLSVTRPEAEPRTIGTMPPGQIDFN